MHPAATEERVAKALSAVSADDLRATVELLSRPRHFTAEAETNRWAAGWIEERLRACGYETLLQGRYANVVALPRARAEGAVVLVGAHYDSVPGCPGADDNASAVAAMLGCARAVSEHFPERGVCFAAFNREEDGLLGSTELVEEYLPQSGLRIREAHVLEMVGYRDLRPGSQKLPADLPIQVSDAGDFLGLIANRDSNRVLDGVLKRARSYLPLFPVLGLKVFLGLEKRLPHLRRSDHAPFWQRRIPALMWTDTSEFRNPHYHQPTDTPETLDYEFLRQVTQLLVAQAAAG
jgi:hypothetical protein